MKKIFTFFVAASMVTAASAQFNENAEGYDKRRDVSFEETHYGQGNRHFNHDHSNFYKREMEMKIAEINRQYDCQMRDVRNNFFMSRYRKQHVLRTLESRRKNKIAEVCAKYNRERNLDYN